MKYEISVHEGGPLWENLIMDEEYKSQTKEITTIFGDKNTLTCKCCKEPRGEWWCMVHGFTGSSGKIWYGQQGMETLRDNIERLLPVAEVIENHSSYLKSN